MAHRPKHILVLLPNPLGDAVLCTPALRHLRHHFPKAHITLSGNQSVCELLDGLDWIDELRPLEGAGMFLNAKWLGGFGFDGVVLLVNSFRSALLIKLAKIPRRIGYDRDGRGWLLTTAVAPVRWGKRFVPISMLDYYGALVDHAIKGLGGALEKSFSRSDRRMELSTQPSDGRVVDALFSGWGISGKDKFAVLVPGGAFGPSKWWPAEWFAALADRFSSDGFKVVLLCAPNEAEKKTAQKILSSIHTPIFNCLDADLSLSAVRELIRRATLMVANDTGPCHIAAAFNVALVTLFGPNDPRWTATGYAKEIRLRVDVACGPCQKPICVTDHRCLERISVEQVYQAAQTLRATNKTDTSNPSNRPAVLKKKPYRVFDESFVPLADGTGLVHQGYLSLLKRHGLDSLEKVFACEQGQKLEKPNLGSRQRLRIELTDEKQEPIVFFIKRYGPPKTKLFFKKPLATAVYDFKSAMELAERGIAVARPIAYGVETKGRSEKRSFVIFEQLPDADALERLLPKWQEKKQKYALLRDRKRLIDEMAAMVRQLHGANYFHRDLYLSHLFLGRDSDGQERLSLIDLHRVFQPILFQRRWQIKDLAQLYYSARRHFNQTDILRFLKTYLDTSRFSSQDKQLLRQVRAKSQRIARHDAKRKKRINEPRP